MSMPTIHVRSQAATYLGKIQTDAKVVIGIDLGTTYSGISFAYKDNPAQVNISAPGRRSRDTVKVPTVLLQTPNEWLFGNDAIDKFEDILEKSSEGNLDYARILHSKGIHLYQNFKMELKDKTTGVDTLSANSTAGKAHGLLDLMTKVLEFLKVFALKQVKFGWGSALGLQFEDYLWVLTVPAIWNDFGKAFMRKAAWKAGIIETEESDKLLLALEPECASIAVHSEAKSMSLFQKGSSFMILDCGGGTVDITTHEVATAEPLVFNELHPPAGGPWGGTYVDEEFEEFLSRLFGCDSFKKLKQKYPIDVEEVKKTFRTLKEDFDPGQGSNKISLYDLLQDDIVAELGIPSLIDMVRAYNGQEGSIPFDLENRQIEKRITRDSTLIFSSSQMCSFFEPTLAKICACVSSILKVTPEIDVIVVVGGYGSCKLLADRIRREFEISPFQRKVIIPDAAVRPQAAIVHGAAWFGLYTFVGSRKAKWSYGVEISTQWETGCGFDESEATWNKTLGHLRVQDVFSRIVKVGTSISPNEEFVKDGYQPIYPHQKSVSFGIYRTTRSNARRVSNGCELIGEVEIPCRSDKDTFRVIFKFATELKVEVVRSDGHKELTVVRIT